MSSGKGYKSREETTPSGRGALSWTRLNARNQSGTSCIHSRRCRQVTANKSRLSQPRGAN